MNIPIDANALPGYLIGRIRFTEIQAGIDRLRIFRSHSPEWIFDEIHNMSEAQAWLKQYNQRNGIKKGKVPTNEETIKMRLYNIYMSNKKRK